MDDSDAQADGVSDIFDEAAAAAGAEDFGPARSQDDGQYSSSSSQRMKEVTTINFEILYGSPIELSTCCPINHTQWQIDATTSINRRSMHRFSTCNMQNEVFAICAAESTPTKRAGILG